MSVIRFLVAMGTTVEVLFDREDRTYRAGDVVAGRVVVESDEEKNLRLIKGTRVRCKGFSTVDLKFGLAAEESGASLSSVNYVDADAKVLTDKLEKTKVRKGSIELTRMETPFSFTLPKDVPSSFKSVYGRMEWIMRVSVPSGVAVSYYEGKGTFTVVGKLDLNKVKGARDPVELKEEARVQSLLGECGKVNFSLKLRKKGWAIGEKLSLQHTVKNESRQPVTTSISLVQRISYELGTLIRLDKANKVKVLGQKEVAGGQEIETDDEDLLTIPSLPPSGVIRLNQANKQVKVEYFLKFEVLAKPKWLKKFKGFMPIIIGSVPLREELPSNSIEQTKLNI